MIYNFVKIRADGFSVETYHGMSERSAERRFEEIIDVERLDVLYFYGPDGLINHWKLPQ